MADRDHSGWPTIGGRDHIITTRENGNSEYDIEVTTEKTAYIVTPTEATTSQETVVTSNVEELPDNDGFKTRFFEAQDRLLELEEELRNTRERLRNLENACENTEEKIGVLKDAAFSYHRQFSEHERSYKTVLEDNRLLKITVEKLETTIRIYGKDRTEIEEIRRSNEDLEDQLNAARKDKEELITQLAHLRDTNAQHHSLSSGSNDHMECQHGAQRDREDDDLRDQIESLKLTCDEIESEKDELKKVKDELSDEVIKLERQLHDLKIKMSADDEVIEEMKGQIADYHVQVTESEENCDRSRMRNIELEREILNLRGCVSELEVSLKSEKDDKKDLIREGTKRLEVQYKKISQLEMSLKEISREKEHLNLQFVDSKNKAEMDSKQLTQQLNEAHVRAELFKKELTDKEKIVMSLKTENEELKGLRDDLAALKEQLQDAQNREQTRFASDHKDEGGDSSDADGEISSDEEQKEESEELRKENEELRQELGQLRDEVISLQSELASQMQETRGNVRKMEEDGGPKRRELAEPAPLAQVEDDLSDYDEKGEELIVVVDESTTLSAEPMARESEDSWSDQDYLKNQIQEMEELLARTKADKERIEEQFVESEEKARRIEEKFVESEEKARRIEAQFVESEEKARRIEEQFVESEEKARRIEEQFVESEEKAKRIEEQFVESEEKARRIEAQFVESEEKARRIEEQFIESEEKAKRTEDELSKTISHLNERCEEMRKELIEKEIILTRMRNEDSLNKSRLRELEEKLREKEYLEVELEKAKREILNLTSLAYNNHEEKYERLKDENERIKNDRDELKKKKEHLAKQNEQLTTEIDSMKEQFEAGKVMYNELCDDNDCLKKGNIKLRDELKFLQEELKEEEDLHWGEKEELTNKNKNLQGKVQELEVKLADLEAMLTEKEDETNWKEKYDEEKRERDVLQIEKQRLEENLQKSEDEHEDTKSKYGKARRELSDIRGENTKLIQQQSDFKLAKDAELTTLKENLKKKEEECRRYLKELDELKEALQRQASEGGWQEKFESLKLKFDEVEDEKDSLQKEKKNLQNELRMNSGKLAEVEIMLSQAKMEKEGLSNDFQKSQLKTTQLEMELQRTAKQKQQTEEEAKWIKKELLTREETIARLGRELSDRGSVEDGESSEKDARIVVLEREIQILHSRIPTSEKDESVQVHQIQLLEENIKNVTEQLDGKTVQLEEFGKENERLTVHVVELSKEIQSLYQRYEASQARVAELQTSQPMEPVVPEKIETTSLTIDVERTPEVRLGVHVQERVRSRVVTPGLARSTCSVDVPISLVPGTVVIGEPVGVTVDYNMAGSPVVMHSTDVTASEPEDNDQEHSSDESEHREDIPPVIRSQGVESAPSPLLYHPPVVQVPERIRVGAQAIPGPQLPRSLDPERYPFIKGSGVRLNPGAFQPVPARRKQEPFRSEDNLYKQEQATSFEVQSMPGGRFKAHSETDLNRLDGLKYEPGHFHRPHENGLADRDSYDETAEAYYQNDEEWPEAYLGPPQDADFPESAPGPGHPTGGMYPQPTWEKRAGDPKDNEYNYRNEDSRVPYYPNPYEAPPRQPESSYTRRIMGVYDNNGKLIGYQEVYEEKTGDYSSEVDGTDWSGSNAREMPEASQDAVPYREPLFYDNERYPPDNIPYTTSVRQRVDRNESPWYNQRYDRDFPPKDTYDDPNYRQPYNTAPRGEVRGGNWGREHASSLSRQYAIGSYL